MMEDRGSSSKQTDVFSVVYLLPASGQAIREGSLELISLGPEGCRVRWDRVVPSQRTGENRFMLANTLIVKGRMGRCMMA